MHNDKYKNNYKLKLVKKINICQLIFIFIFLIILIRAILILSLPNHLCNVI